MFKKGQSGNPGGRPKRDPDELSAAEVQALAKKYSKVAIDTLVDVAQKSTSDTARISAASTLLDRAYGRPHQTLEASVTTHVDPATISDEQLASFLSATSKAHPAHSSGDVAEAPSDTKKLN